MSYSEIKALHIVLVMGWFAGLFFLPRLFVNLAEVAPESAAERARLLQMADKLHRYITIVSLPAVLVGFWLWIGFDFKGMWLDYKVTLVFGLIAYNLHCRKILRDFHAERNMRSKQWLRWFGEAPFGVLIAIVFLAVLKPF